MKGNVPNTRTCVTEIEQNSTKRLNFFDSRWKFKFKNYCKRIFNWIAWIYIIQVLLFGAFPFLFFGGTVVVMRIWWNCLWWHYGGNENMMEMWHLWICLIFCEKIKHDFERSGKCAITSLVSDLTDCNQHIISKSCKDM